MPGDMATSTYGFGGEGANIPCAAEDLNHLLTLEHSLRSGGTPKVMNELDPGECMVPGLPNKTSSRPTITTPHTRCVLI